ncbi:FG-GAP repeat domain-containing protein [candidate division KSB1 bacterium]
MDWNNDGINDLISGDTDGSVWVFINEGTKEEPVLAEGKQVEANGKVITKEKVTYKRVDGKVQTENDRPVIEKTVPANHELAGPYSKLHYADWTGDGLDDILIGQLNNIVLYKNTGSKSNPEFGDPVELTNAGGEFPDRSSPFIYDWDNDGINDLVIGTESGEIFFYKNTGSERSPELAEAKEIELTWGETEGKSYRHRLDITDWNNDGLTDLLIGDFYSVRTEETSKMGGFVWLFLGK